MAPNPNWDYLNWETEVDMSRMNGNKINNSVTEYPPKCTKLCSYCGRPATFYKVPEDIEGGNYYSCNYHKRKLMRMT